MRRVRTEAKPVLCIGNWFYSTELENLFNVFDVGFPLSEITFWLPVAGNGQINLKSCASKKVLLPLLFLRIYFLLERITLFTSQSWKYTCVFRTRESKIADSELFNDTVIPYYNIVFWILLRTFVISTEKIWKLYLFIDFSCFC